MKAAALRRVLTNLIVNSLDALAQVQRAGFEPTLILETRSEGGKVELEIRDNGQGIDKKNLEAIRSGVAVTTKKDGHGIGLRTSIDRVRAYGGDVSLESELGLGTVCRVQIPRAN
jgi:signal transduction histidine kinase